MKRIDCDTLLDRLLDASPHDRSVLDDPVVRRHLESCGACRTEVADVEELWARTDALARDVPVSPEVWSRVSERLRPRNHRFGAASLFRWTARLAAAALLMVGGAAVDRQLRTEPGGVTPGPGSVPDEAMPLRAAEVDLGRAGFVEARGALWRLALTRSGQVSPTELDGLLQGLAAVEEARLGLEAALAAAPGEPRTLAMLERIRRRELALLKQLALPDRERPRDAAPAPTA